MQGFKTLAQYQMKRKAGLIYMAKNYFCKCGRTFTKSSTAVVTRFENFDDKCSGCIFIEKSSSYRGGKEVPITFCQAGSKKPNNKNDYSTTSENDATTLSVISLDMEFLKNVYDFACSMPGFARSAEWPKVFHGLDKEDCRKSMPLYFENNKKGKTAKKAIIELYFKQQKQEKIDNCNKCNDCISYKEDDKENGYGKCEARRTLRGSNEKACDKFTHKNEEVMQCPECGYKGKPFDICPGCGLVDWSEDLNSSNTTEEENNRCPFYKSHKEDEAFIQCRDIVNVHHEDWIRTRENGELHNRYYHYTCCGTYYACALYQEQAGDREKTCGTCVNRGYIPEARGEKVNCPILNTQVDGHNPETVCSWHDKLWNKAERVMDEEERFNIVKEDSQVSSDDDTGCKKECDYNRKGLCSLETIKGRALEHFAMDIKDTKCESAARKLKVRYLKEERNCVHANEGCNAVLRDCALNNEYCCYTCSKPCISHCSYSVELVPYGKVKKEDMMVPAEAQKEIQDMSLDGHLNYIQNKADNIITHYIEIGFALVSIRDKDLYKDRGYSNLIECVEAELNMKKSTCYNLIKIANTFGDPEVKAIKPEYRQYGYVQLLEMATMSEEELSQVTPDMSKREMQKIKKNSNQLEKSQEESPKKSTSENIKINRQMQIGAIKTTNDGIEVINITEYKVIQENIKEGQEQPENKEGEENNTAAHQEENNIPENASELVQETYEEVSATDEQLQEHEQEQPVILDHKDIENLLEENENYRVRLDVLEKERSTLWELVREIDSRFDKLTKQQIKDSLWGFITTGTIIFEQTNKE